MERYRITPEGCSCSYVVHAESKNQALELVYETMLDEVRQSLKKASVQEIEDPVDRKYKNK